MEDSGLLMPMIVSLAIALPFRTQSRTLSSCQHPCLHGKDLQGDP